MRHLLVIQNLSEDHSTPGTSYITTADMLQKFLLGTLRGERFKIYEDTLLQFVTASLSSLAMQSRSSSDDGQGSFPDKT